MPKTGIHSFGSRGGVRSIKESKENTKGGVRLTIKDGISMMVEEKKENHVAKKHGMYELSKKGHAQKVRENPYGKIKPRKFTMVNGVCVLLEGSKSRMVKVWSCQMCSMENKIRSLKCSICEYPRSEGATLKR